MKRILLCLTIFLWFFHHHLYAQEQKAAVFYDKTELMLEEDELSQEDNTSASLLESPVKVQPQIKAQNEPTFREKRLKRKRLQQKLQFPFWKKEKASQSPRDTKDGTGLLIVLGILALLLIGLGVWAFTNDTARIFITILLILLLILALLAGVDVFPIFESGLGQGFWAGGSIVVGAILLIITIAIATTR